MIITFLNQFLFVLAALFLLGGVGGFLIAPFSTSIKFPLFAAPMAGLLILTLGVSALYSVVGLSLIKCSLVVLVLGIVTTIFTLIYLSPKVKKPDFFLGLSALLLIAMMTYFTNYTTITNGSSGLLYSGGSDHLGYGHLADWLSMHLVSQLPHGNATTPYQIWPEFLFKGDPRFGSFYFLGIITSFYNHSAAFSYDLACGIVLLVSFFGVAAVFSQNRLTFLLLLIGLFISGWFDYSRCGYFGKIIGYPAFFFVMGIFFHAERPIVPRKLIILTSFACATACVYPGYCIAALFAAMGGIFILLKMSAPNVFKDKTYFVKEVLDEFLIVILFIGISITALGCLSKPGTYGSVDAWVKAMPLFNLSIPNGLQTLPLFFHLEHFGFLKITGLTMNQISFLTIISAVVVLLLLVLSFRNKDVKAMTTIICPTVFIGFFLTFNQSWLAYQFIGIYYPLFLCGSIMVLDGLMIQKENHLKMTYLAIFAVIVFIGMHYPRFAGSINIYAGKGISPQQQFLKKDFDQLENAIGRSKVIIDIAPIQEGQFKGIQSVMFTLPLFVELGRRNILMQFTPRTWSFLFSWTGVAQPKVDANAHLWLTMADDKLRNKNCKIKFKNTQYQLIEC